SYADVEPTLSGRIEELIDFVNVDPSRTKGRSGGYPPQDAAVRHADGAPWAGLRWPHQPAVGPVPARDEEGTMTQTPHPHDPYAQQPAAEPHAAEPAADGSGQGAPTSDPALHPYDPYAVGADAPRSNPLDIDAEPAPQQAPPAHDPYAVPQAPYAQQAPSGQQPPYGPGAAQGGTVPPAGTAGVHDGPLTGQAVSESDSRLWATVA